MLEGIKLRLSQSNNRLVAKRRDTSEETNTPLCPGQCSVQQRDCGELNAGRVSFLVLSALWWGGGE